MTGKTTLACSYNKKTPEKSAGQGLVKCVLPVQIYRK
jgi:hypothetical protein